MGRRDPELVEEQALNDDTRVRIFALFTENEGRSLAAPDLLHDLRTKYPREYDGTRPSQIHYHRACLQDAGLLPA